MSEIESGFARRKPHALLCFIFLGACLYSLFFQSMLSIPPVYRINVGERVSLGNTLPRQISRQIIAYVSEGGQKLRWKPGDLAAGTFYPFLGKSPVAAVPGMINLDLRLFGLVPLKKVTLQVVPPVKVVVGGHSIGVLLHAQGVVVVGYADIRDTGGSIPFSPARRAGILPGDVIIKVEGKTVQSDSQLSFLIDQLARRKEVLRFQIKRGGTLLEYRIKPGYCQETKRYRVGLYVRDGAAGIGTLTFYEPNTGKYGALGHMITDAETNKSLNLSDGKIVGAMVQGIHKGEKGKIGEKVGVFFSNGKTTGNIEKNTAYGIFGRMQGSLNNPLYTGLIPVAMGYQIEKGKAKMLTVLDGEEIEAFDIEIQSVFGQPRSDGKAFIIKIVDPELIQRTGGIIQGMSGSPIIQNGRLVGAVTHVFINDPTRGYGVLAESMLEETGLLSTKKLRKASGLSLLMTNSGRFLFSAPVLRTFIKALQEVSRKAIFFHGSKKDLGWPRRIS